MKLLIAPLVLAAVAASSWAQGPTLGLGDAAPPLKVAKWFKGQPIEKLGAGKVHVVEFWATWCGPCKVSIPHLTEVAKKFKGKATITGVSVWENSGNKWDPGTFDKIQKFVADMGPKMDYVVAADGPDGTMAKTWMTAAGQNGIPSAFIVDKTGKVVWIGHPMGGLEEALAQVVAGTYDLEKEKAKAKAEKEAAARRTALLAPYSKAVAEKRHKDAAAELDKIAAADPELAPQARRAKLTHLLQVDGAEASRWALSLAEGDFKTNADMLNSIAWSLVDDQAKGIAAGVDYGIAEKIAEMAVALSKGADGTILDTLAFAQFRGGKIDEAIASQQKAIAVAEKDTKVNPATLGQMKARLEQFKTAKK